MEAAPRAVVVALSIGAALFVLARRGAAGAVDEGDPDMSQQPIQPPDPGIVEFAKAIAVAEGFHKPGSRPAKNHNPGDLMLNGSLEAFTSDWQGWNALYRQLELARSGRSHYYNPEMTIAEFAATYTATEVDAWTNNVVRTLQAAKIDATPDTPIGDILNT